MLDPGDESSDASAAGDARGLMGEIGADVAVGEDNLALVQGGFEFGLGFEAIAGVEQGG